jgi:ribose transport system ATP-binding protein
LTSSLLELRGVSKRFHGVHALSDVSLTLQAGEVHALCGANGAGKSTLMKVLMGVHPPDAGSILLMGNEVTVADPEAARAMGIDMVFQEIELPPSLTVAEAIFLAREPTRLGLIDYSRMFAETRRVMGLLGVSILPSTPVESLSVAEKQLVQIARALAGRTRLLVLDEPTSALTEHETRRLFDILHRLRDQGAAIVYVSHRLDEIFLLAQYITVLRDGQVVGAGSTASLTPDELVRMMAGDAEREAHDPPEPAVPTGSPVLEVRGLRREPAVREVSLQLHAGEVLGLFGIVGAGRTELARCLFGLDRPTDGTILMDGREVSLRGPAEAMAHGLALVPEDRKLQGLILEMSLRENVALPCLDRLRRNGWVDAGRERELATRTVRDLSVVARSIEQDVRQLSGGNQQKVVIGKWLATQPRVLILDEPTKGIDVAAKREIHGLIRRLAKAGLGVILISSELEEVLGLSDRLVVLRDGRISGVLPRVQANHSTVMGLAVG